MRIGNPLRLEENALSQNIYNHPTTWILALQYLLVLIWTLAAPLVATNIYDGVGNVVYTCAASVPEQQEVIMIMLFIINGLLFLMPIYFAAAAKDSLDSWNRVHDVKTMYKLVSIPLILLITAWLSPSLDYVGYFFVGVFMLTVVPLMFVAAMIYPRIKYATSKNMSKRSSDVGAIVNSNEMSPSGVSKYNFSIRKRIFGTPWRFCTITIIPEMDLMIAVDNIKSKLPEVYFIMKLSTVSLVQENVSLEISNVLRNAGIDYIIETADHEVFEKFKGAINAAKSRV